MNRARSRRMVTQRVRTQRLRTLGMKTQVVRVAVSKTTLAALMEVKKSRGQSCLIWLTVSYWTKTLMKRRGASWRT